MSPTEDVDGPCTASFCFPEDFLGFSGHFPNGPVLPGVCIVQAVIEMMQSCLKVRVVLREVRKAAFFAPVTVGDECRFECAYGKGEDGDLTTKTMVTRKGEKVAKIDLTLATGKRGSE